MHVHVYMHDALCMVTVTVLLWQCCHGGKVTITNKNCKTVCSMNCDYKSYHIHIILIQHMQIHETIVINQKVCPTIYWPCYFIYSYMNVWLVIALKKIGVCMCPSSIQDWTGERDLSIVPSCVIPTIISITKWYKTFMY